MCHIGLMVLIAVLCTPVSGASANAVPPNPGVSSTSNTGHTFTSRREAVDYYEKQGFVMMGSFTNGTWPATVVYEKSATNEITFVLKSGQPHAYPRYDGYTLKAVAVEDASGGESMLVFRSIEKIDFAPEAAAAGPTTGAHVAGKDEPPRASASSGSSMGHSFPSLRLAFDYYEGQGFHMMGSFPEGKWPAKVIYEKEATNEINFVLKSGQPMSYPANDGYRMKAVALEDDAGGEIMLVFRSIEKMWPPPVEKDAGPVK